MVSPVRMCHVASIDPPLPRVEGVRPRGLVQEVTGLECPVCTELFEADTKILMCAQHVRCNIQQSSSAMSVSVSIAIGSSVLNTMNNLSAACG